MLAWSSELQTLVKEHTTLIDLVACCTLRGRSQPGHGRDSGLNKGGSADLGDVCRNCVDQASPALQRPVFIIISP
jgi:hypothetical protein